MKSGKALLQCALDFYWTAITAKRYHKTLPLMGATRPASVFQQPRLAEKLELYYNLMTSKHTINSKLKYLPHEKSTNQRYHHRRAH